MSLNMENDLRLDSNLLTVLPEDEEQLPPIAQMLPPRGNITPEVIVELESDLDFHETVSLVFLLYDNVDLALQQLKVKSASVGTSRFCGLLSEWAYRQQGNVTDWEEKFLEALCIIQNYFVVQKLGYTRRDVEELYLPGNRETTLNVDLMRKAFYVVCEELTNDQGKILIDLVKEDLGYNPPNFINEAPQLEVFFLDWISRHYIQFQNRNIKNITKHLKVMGLITLVDYLDSIFRRYQNHVEIPVPASNESIPEDDNNTSYGNLEIPSHSDVGSVYEENTSVSDEVYYNIDPTNIGVCVIINQKNFYREPNPELKPFLPFEDLEDRVGTDIDRDRLSEAFGNFGFKVNIWENLDHLNLLNSIDKAVNELVKKEHSCFVLCILSHGIKNEVYGTNSIPVPIEEIHTKIQGKNCPKLINKPKIIIIQACQGHEQQDVLDDRNTSNADVAADGPSSSRMSPEVSDSVISWSTVPGFASFRDRLKGSWYIQTLCDILLDSTTGVDILEVFLAVNGKIKSKVAIMNMQRKSMQPVFNVTLCKKLFWPCNASARKTVAEMMIKRHLFNTYLDEYLLREVNTT